MLRSLFTGISGMRANQTMMDTVGNNIANVNTTGFKSSNTVFQDTLSQLIQNSSAPTATTGGRSPAQVGLGVRVAGITTNFTQGAAQTTGRASDVMIQGDGFLVEKNGGQTTYTRNGSLSFDALGRLVGPSGGIVQGWTADATGTVDNNTPTGNITVPLGSTLAPNATTLAKLSGNLPADTPLNTPVTKSVDVYDANGVSRRLSMSFNRTGADTWDVSLDDGTSSSTGTLTFSGSGASPSPSTFNVGGVDVDLSQVTGYAGLSTVGIDSQDGSSAGTLQGFSIGGDGVLTGTFSNGLSRALGQIAMATFSNPAGLVREGDSGYSASTNSGLAQIGTPDSGSRGTLAGGMLEMSNVDLGQEFTNLIISQRGFQANSRIISAGDEILQDLINIKR
ncbi:flagellar hook protein FlgE [Angustibacter aerolatus]